ncbi:phosphatase domain-containing putative toxin [Archangium lansingense]|uniref:Protein-tyrosine phosphatase family protein n=1 Tax=Archangium lansingense TaxID=2995310 RepID=A0ABT4AEY6_9BACT|nr:protein-tyrosine phosphatase family protein [Archangium lansinium]MCY1080228.1 protein-tyrosine phosphatase family protein [Archangium lansinium]
MHTPIYWVETGVAGRLGIMARPRAGDWLADEVQGLRDSGVDGLVSLLTPEEEAELGLQGEHQACENAGLRFLSLPIADRGVPPRDAATLGFLRQVRDEVRAGSSIAVHCRMGIGRSSLVAASVLALLGVNPDEALQRLATARGLPVPDTEEQRQWVLHLPL